MTQTNIDSLFQVIVPPTDRGASATRTGDGTPVFDDHLSKASTSIYSPTDYSSAMSKSSPSSQTPAGSDDAKPPLCPPAPPKQDQAGESRASTNESEKDERSDDDGDDITAAESSVAQAAAGKEDAPKPEPKDRKADHALRVHAKDAPANAKDVAIQALGMENGEITAAKAKEETTTIDAALAAAEQEVTNEETAQAADNGEQVEQGKESASTKKQTNGGKRTTVPTKAATDGEFANVDSQSNQFSNPGESVLAVSGKVEQVASGKQSATGNAPTAAAKTKTGAEHDSDDDSSVDKASARANSQSDAGVSAAKAAAAAIANTVSANVTDASNKNDDSSEKAGEETIKPVSSKPDPPGGTLDRLNRAASELARGTRSAENSDTPRVDPARFVGRVAKAFQTANERGGTLQLRLSPPELGALRIQLTVKDGVMSAALETDNAGARRVLLDHLPALRDRLAEQNIRIEKFDVDVRQEGSGGQANPHGSNQNPYQPQPDRNVPRPGRAQQRTTEVAMPAMPQASPQISSSGINLFV